MPGRDEQDYERRRQQIIDGALYAFAHKGFERATNKDIAEAAGIRSAGLIYHYFKDKADLLRQVVEERAPMLQLLNQHESLMRLPPREALPLLGATFVKTLDNHSTFALFKLILGEAVRRPAFADMINAIGPSRGFTFFRRYLEQQMAAGTLRQTDPGAAARCFLGPLIAFVLTREVFPQADSQQLSAEAMVALTVEIFLAGMEPERTSTPN